MLLEMIADMKQNAAIRERIDAAAEGRKAVLLNLQRANNAKRATLHCERV